MDNIQVWFDAEQVKEKGSSKIFVSLSDFRGDVIFTKSHGYKLCLFLDAAEADNLAFAINCNLKNLEFSQKEALGNAGE